MREEGREKGDWVRSRGEIARRRLRRDCAMEARSSGVGVDLCLIGAMLRSTWCCDRRDRCELRTRRRKLDNAISPLRLGLGCYSLSLLSLISLSLSLSLCRFAVSVSPSFSLSFSLCTSVSSSLCASEFRKWFEGKIKTEILLQGQRAYFMVNGSYFPFNPIFRTNQTTYFTEKHLWN